MMDKLTSKWLMMKPSHKTAAMWGGGILLLIVAVFSFSSQPVKVVRVVEEANEFGAFEVNDEDVTIEALGTQMKAQSEQIRQLKQQLNSSNANQLKNREIISSLSGSDDGLRIRNEMIKRMNRVEEMVDKVANKQELIGLTSSDDTAIIIDGNDDLSDKKSKDNPVKVVSPVVEPIIKRPVKSKPMFTNSVTKTEIPDDPLAFIKSVSKTESVKLSSNQFINAPEGKDVQRTRRNSAGVDIVTSTEEEIIDVESLEEQYVGERLLAGSLIPVTVVSGVDAPTGKAAEKGAISSTLRVTGPVILPNGYRVDLTGCLITTDVRGDTATERAYFRPNRLTCHYEYGSVDVPIQGYVSGKDGVQGFRGRVVSKQGKALFYGAIAGGISGVADAFGGGSNNSVVVGGGNNPFPMPNSQEVAQAAASGAISESADFLAEYYKSKLEQLYEVIEIKPLIVGSVHILKTFQLELLEEIKTTKNKKRK